MLMVIDTTLDACSVALAADGRIVSSACEARRRGHAEALVPMIESVAAAAGGTDRIRRILVTTGPGTFTGVRVGIAAAKGLGLALGFGLSERGDAGLAGIGSLEALAVSAVAHCNPGPGSRICCAIDARRGEVYVATYEYSDPDQRLLEVLPPARIEVATADDTLWGLGGDGSWLIGSGAKLLAHHARDAQIVNDLTVPDAEALALFADRCWHQFGVTAVKPIYLRPPDATLPTEAGRR